MIEEDQEVQIGVELLTSTRPKWVTSPLGGHISWHLALYYLGMFLSYTPLVMCAEHMCNWNVCISKNSGHCNSRMDRQFPMHKKEVIEDLGIIERT